MLRSPKRIFQQSKVELPEVVLLHSLKRVRRQVSYFDCPLTVLHKWSCIIVTDKGNYENTTVVCVDRDQRDDSGCVIVTFTPMEVIGCGHILGQMVYDDTGTLVANRPLSIYVRSGDTLNITYTVNV